MPGVFLNAFSCLFLEVDNVHWAVMECDRYVVVCLCHKPKFYISSLYVTMSLQTSFYSPAYSSLLGMCYLSVQFSEFPILPMTWMHY